MKFVSVLLISALAFGTACSEDKKEVSTASNQQQSTDENAAAKSQRSGKPSSKAAYLAGEMTGGSKSTDTKEYSDEEFDALLLEIEKKCQGLEEDLDMFMDCIETKLIAAGFDIVEPSEEELAEFEKAIEEAEKACESILADLSNVEEVKIEAINYEDLSEEEKAELDRLSKMSEEELMEEFGVPSDDEIKQTIGDYEKCIDEKLAPFLDSFEDDTVVPTPPPEDN